LVKRCQHCQACLNWCPKKAISFRRLQPSSPRYHHPLINCAEFIQAQHPASEQPE
jgi:ferredoxin